MQYDPDEQADDEVVEDREAAVRARSAEILARQPTADEIADREARRQRSAQLETMTLDQLEREWVHNPHMDADRYQRMRQLQAAAKAERAAAAVPVARPAPAPEHTRRAPEGPSFAEMRRDAERDIRYREAQGKLERGERLTEDELWAVHEARLAGLTNELGPRLPSQFAYAFGLIYREIAGASIVNRLKREGLEDRIAALEVATKPRVRRAAPSRPA